MTRDLVCGGAAHAALKALAEMGGSATLARLAASALAEFRSAGRFQQLVQVPLERRKLITVRGQNVRITTAGEVWLRQRSKRLFQQSEALVDTGFKPLRLHSMMPLREGALDYRNYPSMNGGQRVPYKSSLTVGGDINAAPIATPTKRKAGKRV